MWYSILVMPLECSTRSTVVLLRECAWMDSHFIKGRLDWDVHIAIPLLLLLPWKLELGLFIFVNVHGCVLFPSHIDLVEGLNFRKLV
jgi:hypothetical protein